MNNKGIMGVVAFLLIIVTFLIFIMFVFNNSYNSIEKFCIQNGYTSVGIIDTGYNSERYFCINENRTTEVIFGMDGRYYLMKEEVKWLSENVIFVKRNLIEIDVGR